MVRKNKSLFKGSAYLVAAAVLYATFGIFSRTVGLTIPIFYQNATRAGLACLMLTFIVTVRGGWKPVSPGDFRILFLRAIAGSAAFLSFFYTIITVPFGPSYFLFYSGIVLFGYLFGHFWFSEHLTKIKGISLGFAILGLFLVYQVNTAVMNPLYVGLAVFSGATTTIWNVISKKISGTYHASLISFWDEAITGTLYIFASILTREQWSVPAMTQPWAASLGIGVLFVATGMLMVTGFRYIEAQIGSIILLAEIPFAIVMARIFYGESLSLTTLIGGAFIVTAIVLPQLYASRK